MLTRIDVDDLQGSSLVMRTVPQDGPPWAYILKNAEGLDPGKASISMSSFGTLDGSRFQSARLEPRNIVLTIAINPFVLSDSVAGTRLTFFKFFIPKREIKLNFFMNEAANPSYTINGIVESCDAPMFTKNPEVVVSILCPDPLFSAIAPTTVNGYGRYNSNTELTVNYTGKADTGYLLTLNPNRSITGFTLYNRLPSGSVYQIPVTVALQSADVVKISTEQRNKYITLTRSGVTTSILYAVGNPADWAPLRASAGGQNYFRIAIPSSGADIPYSLVYTTKYGGI